MATAIHKRKLKKVVKNEQTIKRVWKLKKNKIKTRFQDRVKESVDVDAPNLRNIFKKWYIATCDEVCGRNLEKTTALHGGGMKR